MLLDHAQQLRLHSRRKFANLIEKERALVRQRKGAIAHTSCTGECTLLVAKELAPGKLRHNRGAIYDHQFPFIGACVQGMNQASCKFFACSGFACNERGCTAEFPEINALSEGPAPRVALADEIVSHQW